MDSWSRDRGSERGREKESERRGEIEQRGSSRVIGLRHAANAASSSLYSLFKHYFCSPPPSLPFNPTYPVSNHSPPSLRPPPPLSPLPHSFKALSVLFHLLKFLVPSFPHVLFLPLHTAPLGLRPDTSRE